VPGVKTVPYYPITFGEGARLEVECMDVVYELLVDERVVRT
jgi:hypothetical protein